MYGFCVDATLEFVLFVFICTSQSEQFECCSIAILCKSIIYHLPMG